MQLQVQLWYGQGAAWVLLRYTQPSMAEYCCKERSKGRNSPAWNAGESAANYLESQCKFRILSRKVLLTFCIGLKQLKAKQFHWYISGVRPEFLLNDKFNYSSSALTFSWLYVGIQACKLYKGTSSLVFSYYTYKWNASLTDSEMKINTECSKQKHCGTWGFSITSLV